MDDTARRSAVLPILRRERSTWRRLYLLWALLGVVGAASGCRSVQNASPTLAPLAPTGVTTTATAPTPTVTSPAPTGTSDPPPAGAGAPPPDTPLTREGAETFARYWFEEFDRAYDHMDPAIIAAITTADCVSCQAYLRDLRQTKAAGQSYKEGRRTLLFVVAAPLEGSSASVLVTFATQELLVVDAAGGVVERVHAEPKMVVEVALNRTGGSWVVREVTRT